MQNAQESGEHVGTTHALTEVTDVTQLLRQHYHGLALLSRTALGWLVWPGSLVTCYGLHIQTYSK